ncbi:hypothetical protein [Flavobacterium tyrosinilyticum]|uniref:hypothetical protein n=1 Tax=Flavobacterium tyrosinilyticum TaxID=1658740 RepID=UPI0020300C77|nr:hypothetical protein [Flavobacterium tyrosinilyticum]MCM0667756.1 hypothetical protein [Flavobacterium tyrosinilyticum]
MNYTMQFLNKYNEVKKFQIIKNDVYTIFNNNLRVIEEFNDTIINFNSDDLFIVNDKLFSDENFYYDTKKKETSIIDQLSNYYYNGIHYNNYLVFTNQELVIYSLEESAVIRKIPFFEDSSLFLMFKDSFLSRGNDFYSFYDLDTLKKIWQYSFSELLQGEDVRQYGNTLIYENKIFMYLVDDKNPKKVATISMDINSGAVVNVYQDLAGNLMLLNDRIYVASYELIKVLDLNSNEIIELDFKDILTPLKLSIHWNTSVVYGDYLYFVDGHSYTTNKLGVLDLKLKKLVWNGEIKIQDEINNNIQKIKIVDGRLYVHCSDNTLHVFQIE